MSNQQFGRSLFPLLGFCYGVYLSYIAFLSAGAGHGSYLLMGAFSAPLGALQNVAVALCGTPILWWFMGILLARVNRLGWRIGFLAVMLTHYVGTFFLLSIPNQFGDWYYFGKVFEKHPLFLISGLASYVLGQIGLWIGFSFTVSDSLESK